MQLKNIIGDIMSHYRSSRLIVISSFYRGDTAIVRTWNRGWGWGTEISLTREIYSIFTDHSLQWSGGNAGRLSSWEWSLFFTPKNFLMALFVEDFFLSQSSCETGVVGSEKFGVFSFTLTESHWAVGPSFEGDSYISPKSAPFSPSAGSCFLKWNKLSGIGMLMTVFACGAIWCSAACDPLFFMSDSVSLSAKSSVKFPSLLNFEVDVVQLSISNFNSEWRCPGYYPLHPDPESGLLCSRSFFHFLWSIFEVSTCKLSLVWI